MTTTVEYIKTVTGLKKVCSTVVTKEELIDFQGTMLTCKNSCGDTITGVLIQSNQKVFVLLGINEQTSEVSTNRYFEPATTEEVQNNFISGKWKYVGRAKITAKSSS